MSMSPSPSNADEAIKRPSVFKARSLAVLACTTAVILTGLLWPMSSGVRGANDDPRGPRDGAKPSAPASRPEFLGEIRRILIAQQDRMVELANRVFQYEDNAIGPADQIPSRKTLVESAKARYETAKIAREAAEIKVKEYIEGTFVQDLALADLEIKLAQEELASTRDETKQAEDHLARIKQASRGSVGDISLEFEFERKVYAAKLGERRAGFSLEMAQSKKKVLVEYTKKATHKMLLSEVEKAHSDELAKKATWELELSKSTKLERDAKQKSLPTDLRRSLILLERAIAVQDQIRQKLDLATKPTNITDSLQKEIQDLTSQLRALVDEADGIRAALQFDTLKPEIHRAAERAGIPKTGSAPVGGKADSSPRADPTATPPRPSSSQSEFVAEVHRILTVQCGRAVEISSQLFGSRADRERQEDQLLNQEITTKSAAANYENAKLTREVAEIAVIEYTEGIFVQDQQTAEGELILARSDLDRQRDNPEMFKIQLANVERASSGSAWDLAVEFGLHDAIVDAQRRERKARRDVSKAEGKVKMLNGFAKSIRTHELRAEIEAARAEELAKQAAYESEMAKERRLAAVAGKDDNGRPEARPMRSSLLRLLRAPSGTFQSPPSADQKRVLSLLEQAISVEEQIRGRLNRLSTDAKLDSSRQNEIRSLVRQLQAIIDDAEAERSALQLSRLIPRIHREASEASAEKK